MNKFLIAGAAITLIYLLTRKKGLQVDDLKKNSNAPAPNPSDSKKQSVESNVSTGKVNANFAGFPSVQVTVDDIRVLKKPIHIRPQNAIPDRYDRGVGAEVNATGKGHFNLAGLHTENVQKACQCADKKHGEYKMDIPILP